MAYLESDTWENLPAPEGSFLEKELKRKMVGKEQEAMIKEVNAADIETCKKKCFVSGLKCKSVNYNQMAQKCQLNSLNKDDEVKLESNTNFVYLERVLQPSWTAVTNFTVEVNEKRMNWDESNQYAIKKGKRLPLV